MIYILYHYFLFSAGEGGVFFNVAQKLLTNLVGHSKNKTGFVVIAISIAYQLIMMNFYFER